MVSLRRRKNLGFRTDTDNSPGQFRLTEDGVIVRNIEHDDNPVDENTSLLDDRVEKPPEQEHDQDLLLVTTDEVKTTYPKVAHLNLSEEIDPTKHQDAEDKGPKQGNEHNKYLDRLNEGKMFGVYPTKNKWKTQICANGSQTTYLGVFDSLEEATRLHDRAAYVLKKNTNFELDDEEKKLLEGVTWEDFYAQVLNDRE